MKKADLSVIVPVYNLERVLGRCLDSILKQTFSEFELILIDDGSLDASGQICDLYAKRDKRIRVLHQDNKGVSVARNRGLEIIQGTYVMFVDGDDIINPTFFEEYVTAIKETNCDVVIGGISIIEENGEINICRPMLEGIHYEQVWETICLETEQFGYICNKIFRTKIIEKNHVRFRTDMYSQEDLDFCISVYQFCNSFCFISNVDYQYYHTTGKRIPPIWDFISNQLKLLCIAEEKVQISEKARWAVKNRILTLIFSFFYNMNCWSEFQKAIIKLKSIEGLLQYLENVKIEDERSLIVWFYRKSWYKILYGYFRGRNLLKRLLKK